MYDVDLQFLCDFPDFPDIALVRLVRSSGSRIFGNVNVEVVNNVRERQKFYTETFNILVLTRTTELTGGVFDFVAFRSTNQSKFLSRR